MKIDRNGKAAIFTIEDFVKLLSVYNSSMHELILRIAFYTGERWGAILQLRVEDVYRDAANRFPIKRSPIESDAQRTSDPFYRNRQGSRNRTKSLYPAYRWVFISIPL